MAKLDKKQFIQDIQEFIIKNIEEDLSIEILCIEFHISQSYFRSIFKEIINISPHEFILASKVLRAKELLLTETIGMVSAQLNFCDQSHLNRVFKKYTNLTPYEYKKQNY